MKTIKKTVERVVEETITVYRADDGKEFNSETDCHDYEIDLKRNVALARSDVEVSETLKGFAPEVAGYGWDESCEYIWVMPHSEEAATYLQKAYQSEYSTARFRKDEWMCIEIDGSGNVDLISENMLIRSVEDQFKKMGIKVFFERKETL